MNGWWKVPLTAMMILVAVCLLLGFTAWANGAQWPWEITDRGVCGGVELIGIRADAWNYDWDTGSLCVKADDPCIRYEYSFRPRSAGYEGPVAFSIQIDPDTARTWRFGSAVGYQVLNGGGLEDTENVEVIHTEDPATTRLFWYDLKPQERYELHIRLQRVGTGVPYLYNCDQGVPITIWETN